MVKYDVGEGEAVFTDKGILILWLILLLAVAVVIWSFRIPPKLECFETVEEWSWENIGDLPDRIVCIEGMWSCKCKFYYWNGSKIEKVLMKVRKECCVK